MIRAINEAQHTHNLWQVVAGATTVRDRYKGKEMKDTKERRRMTHSMH